MAALEEGAAAAEADNQARRASWLDSLDVQVFLLQMGTIMYATHNSDGWVRAENRSRDGAMPFRFHRVGLRSYQLRFRDSWLSFTESGHMLSTCSRANAITVTLEYLDDSSNDIIMMNTSPTPGSQQSHWPGRINYVSVDGGSWLHIKCERRSNAISLQLVPY